MKRALLLVLLIGCTAEDRRSPPPKMTAAKAPAALANATQHDLAKELDDADRRGTWSEVKSRWQGQAVRWTVTRHAALCGNAASCNVAAFPIQRPAKHGWMPTLKLAPGAYEALASKCRAVDPCEVTVAGTLAKVDASDSMPTNVTLSDVTIVASR